ncbi:hypothetical protein SAMN05192558_106226 [Actinokineospora alba]|uniref:EspG family protein n=2 Tax=Actinokineospora alba TaxID=504798 RepID=A0A1H0PQ71_9PSEU|nr:hypothetical protein C8E96_1393 [Actinokineospora alba]SDI62604.1 hypothetical protein SAMN05421871_106226 [Actinokineospora alba]SDP07267.1 hypothetical protein SAMN05192558_106226 [Actinokineospora alba]
MATTVAPHRLTLTAGEFAFLVAKLGVSLPPEWEPAPEIATGAEGDALVGKGVFTGSGDLLKVHPSVESNLRVLAAPKIMFDTTATAGTRGSRSLHALAGPVGASLFMLPDGGVELSMFTAVDLGRELVRAVPAEVSEGIGSALDDPEGVEPLRGSVPLAALHELGVADLLREGDPDAPAYVLAELKLPEAEAKFATEVVRRTDGLLRCLVTALVGDGVRTAQVTWLHTDAGWVGVAPSATGSERKLVDLTPVAREDLGVWLTPFVAEALA